MEIRNEELRHMRLLDELVTELGGDSTVLTPSANREALACRGIADVLMDPRTTLLDALESIVIAELTDHEQWVGLIDAARDAGREDLARTFISAESTEEAHLRKVRGWIAAGRTASRSEVVSS
jgi:rubrerythrin